jgi:hypothetical protein
MPALSAQETDRELWLGYINRISLGNQWSVWHDYHFINNTFFLARYGLTYQAANKIRYCVGYAFVNTSTPASTALTRKEHRIWGQAVRNFQINYHWRYSTRYRYDGRFRLALDETGEVVPDRFIFNHRHRVMQSLQYIWKHGSNGQFWHTDLINESLFNTGRNIQNGVDQIRNYLLIGYSNPNITVLVGYHQRLIYRQNAPWRQKHGMTIWVIHSIRLKDESHSTDLTMM